VVTSPIDARKTHLSRHADLATRQGEVVHPEVSLEVVTVPISSLRPGESPRLGGEDKAHIARLAAIETTLPPVLVYRRTMRVIDGMHRLLAASMTGRDSIEVRFFDGSPQDAFLCAVEANVTHGLPLSQADRRSAAERIVESHPHLSDRAIAHLAGLSAKAVGAIRRRSITVPQVQARVGKDGKVRPLNGVEGRQRAAQFIAEHPQASLREVARDTGVSAATVSDVRKRLERGEEPASRRIAVAAAADDQDAPAGTAARPGAPRGVRAMRQVPAFMLDKLLRDPSLRHNEQGRRLLCWLQYSPAGSQDRSSVIDAIPPYCVALVVQLARQNAQAWLDFAAELNERARVIDPWAGG
jgi:hypothetical protein